MSLVGHVTAAGVVKWAESGVTSKFEPGVVIGSSGATARPTVTRSQNTHQQKRNHTAMGFAGYAYDMSTICQPATYVSTVAGWRYADVLAWTVEHERAVFVDATPDHGRKMTSLLTRPKTPRNKQTNHP